MNNTLVVTHSQNLSRSTVDQLLTAIQGYSERSEYAPVKEIQALRDRTGISNAKGQPIHSALMTAFDVAHNVQDHMQSSILATVRFLAENNPQLFTDEQLKGWTDKSLAAFNNSSNSDFVQSAAISFVNSHWDQLRDTEKESFINNCIERIDISADTTSAALKLLKDRMPTDINQQVQIREKALGVLSRSTHEFEQTSAASLIVRIIVNSDFSEEEIINSLQRIFQEKVGTNGLPSVAAIFHAALQAQAGGTTYSQTPIASPSTNGHRHASAAQPHQPATNPAAFARPPR